MHICQHTAGIALNRQDAGVVLGRFSKIVNRVS